MTSVLDKIKEFSFKISEVNESYENFMQVKNNENEKIFLEKWTNLHTEVSEFFSIDLRARTENNQSVIASIDTEAKIMESYIYNHEKLIQGQKRLKRAEIGFLIYNLEDPENKKIGFPYFGLALKLILNYSSTFSVSIAKSMKRNGSMPEFDIKNRIITGRKMELQFISDEDFTKVVELCETTIESVNDVIDKKLSRNIRIY